MMVSYLFIESWLACVTRGQEGCGEELMRGWLLSSIIIIVTITFPFTDSCPINLTFTGIGHPFFWPFITNWSMVSCFLCSLFRNQAAFLPRGCEPHQNFCWWAVVSSLLFLFLAVTHIQHENETSAHVMCHKFYNILARILICLHHNALV